MAIQARLTERLSAQGIDFQIIDDCELTPLHIVTQADAGALQGAAKQRAARLILLADKKQKLQVLIPAHCILDIHQLNVLKDRDYGAMDLESRQVLTQAQDFDSFPSIPFSGDLPLVVDTRLTEPKELYLSLGKDNQYLRLSQLDFAKLVRNAEFLDCSKPLSSLQPQEDDDRAVVESSVKKFTGLRIQRRLQETLDMPPLPAIAEQVIQLRLNPDAGSNELAKLVEQDPSLAAQVVSWAASPYYAAPGAVRSVRDAVIRILGFELVMNLAVGLALGRALEFPADRQQTRSYWSQAVFCAATAEALVKAMPTELRPSVGLTYLSGLLSNFGYLVLAHVFPPHFTKISRTIEVNSHVEAIYSERLLLGLDQDIIASQLLECWSMPEEVVTGIRWQHVPEFDGEHSVYAKLLFISNQLLRSAELIPGPTHGLEESLLGELGLTEDKVLAVRDSIIEQKEDLEAIAGQMG